MSSKEDSLKESKLVPISGLEWFCRIILKSVANEAVELAELCAGVASWEEWEPELLEMRSSKEEAELWKTLEELD